MEERTWWKVQGRAWLLQWTGFCSERIVAKVCTNWDSEASPGARMNEFLGENRGVHYLLQAGEDPWDLYMNVKVLKTLWAKEAELLRNRTGAWGLGITGMSNNAIGELLYWDTSLPPIYLTYGFCEAKEGWNPPEKVESKTGKANPQNIAAKESIFFLGCTHEN